ncbi:metallophosphoesterase [Sellimonas caecigallum]|uniref:Calcineurin-like phosphoesterase domain-containing protein n=1 Tax=Sellimonas caecigallum TaxID=2592333 RepID=A0ABS7L9C1_9FIRM|nr:metallophosphoesterase [Sellimonas caecigallum]MBY0759347.1 hypothetical protein [Sellimonas caecigallum]
MKRNHGKKSRHILMIIILLLVCIAAYIGIDIWKSSNALIVRKYAVSLENCKTAIRAVVISDLHNHSFGAQNKKLVEMISQQNPDLILMAGDMLNEDSKSSEVPVALVRELAQIAPVFYGLGNHEIAYMEDAPVDLSEELTQAGAIVLDKKFVDVKIQGENIRIGGLYDYAFGNNGDNDAMAAPQDIKDFLTEFGQTEDVKIMISHRPDSFIFGDASTVWDVDLVVSGHNHGGQIVIPFLGGLYGGDQGWFPEYIHGIYEKDQLQLFVTSGLGSEKQILPRMNNRPEVALLEIKPEK